MRNRVKRAQADSQRHKAKYHKWNEPNNAQGDDPKQAEQRNGGGHQDGTGDKYELKKDGHGADKLQAPSELPSGLDIFHIFVGLRLGVQ